MSGEEDANKRRPLLTRRIGVGLTRSNLGIRVQDSSPKTSRETKGLTTPSRVVISPSSLAPKRTPSDRYQSSYTGYSRLGDLRRNTSSPNVSTIPNVKEEKSDNILAAEVHANEKKPSSHRINLPSIAKPSRWSQDVSNFHNAQERDRSGNIYESKSETEGLENEVRSHSVDTSERQLTQGSRSKVENYDIDLEEDEEDAGMKAEVKNVPKEPTSLTLKEPVLAKTPTDNQRLIGQRTSEELLSHRSIYGTEPVRVDVTAHHSVTHHSPSKDSGYGSPRIPVETNVEPNATALTSESGSRSKTEGSETPTITEGAKPESMAVPERPARPKSLARKLSGNLGKGDFSLSPRQLDYADSINSANGSANESTINSNRNDVEKSKSIVDQNLGQSETPRSQLGSLESEPAPKARPRSHRRLTKRNISFKRLVRKKFLKLLWIVFKI